MPAMRKTAVQFHCEAITRYFVPHFHSQKIAKGGKKERELVPGYPGEETRASLKKQNFW